MHPIPNSQQLYDLALVRRADLRPAESWVQMRTVTAAVVISLLVGVCLATAVYRWRWALWIWLGPIHRIAVLALARCERSA
jgi:hypothetical protein